MQLIPFNFEYIPEKKKYLLTNITGDYVYLNKKELDTVIKKKLKDIPDTLMKKIYGILVGNETLIEKIIEDYKHVHSFLSDGPSLHIIVVTLVCQLGCVYCHASSEANNKKLHMTKETAEKVVKFILNSKNKDLTIEFQGGEPLLNWDTVKYIIERTHELNKTKNKNVVFTMVSNLEEMDEKKMKFLEKHAIGLCSSLDGPEDIHNKNRPYKTNNYKTVTKWISYVKKHFPNYDLPALTTISKSSLKKPKEIIDTYVNLGMERVFLRPLNPYGRAEKVSHIYYSNEEFFEFYKTGIEYILELNKKGTFFKENYLFMFLVKLFTKTDPGYVDLCSPCGAGIRNLAYNYDGGIYTCDEGRMLAKMNDHSFQLGTVDDDYNAIVESDVVSSCLKSSCLEGKTDCHQCVYKPYCGVCPVYNYQMQDNIHGEMMSNNRCKLHKTLFKYYFELLENKETKEILKKWLSSENQS